MSAYETVFEVLDRGFKASGPPETLVATVHQFGAAFLSSAKYSWIADLFAAVDAIYEQRRLALVAEPDALYSVDRPYDAFFAHSWSASDRVFDLRARISAIFPGRTLYTSVQFIAPGPDGGSFCVPIDYVLMARALRPMLIAGLADLLPSRIKFVDESGLNVTLATTWDLQHDDRVVQIPSNGAGYDDLKKAAVQEAPSVPQLLIASPYLQGCRLDDYVELAFKYPEEFHAYALAAARFKGIRSAPEPTIRDWLTQLDAAALQLEIVLKNKRKELFAKGFDVAAGIACGVACLVAPLSPEAKAMLLTAFSGKTLYDGGRGIYDYVVAKDLISDKNPFWFLWRATRG